MSNIKNQNTIHNEITPITKFEQLPNELILMCFRYFDFYHIYEMFYHLNQRFNQLILCQTKIHLEFHPIPSGKFLTFCFDLNQILTINQNYLLSIVAIEKNKFNIIFYDDLFKDKFSKLKSLTLSNIDATTISSVIFDETIKLYQNLERLSLLNKIGEDTEYSTNINHLCSRLLSSKMQSLKYLYLNFKRYFCACDYASCRRSSDVHLEFYEQIMGDNLISNLETLIIGNIRCFYVNETKIKLWFDTFREKLLPRLPKLKKLTINAIRFDEERYSAQNMIIPAFIKPNIPLNLKVIKLWIDVDNMQTRNVEIFRKYLRKFFMNSNNSFDTTKIKIFQINQRDMLKEEL